MKRPCTYCGTGLSRFEKQLDGKWRKWDTNGNEHTYKACKAEQETNKWKQQNTSSYQPNHQTTTKPISNYVAKTSTFPVNEKEGPNPSQGVSIFSLHIMVSESRKEIKELRKQIETLASIIDSMAQKQDLMVERVGYPEPEPVLKDRIDKLGEIMTKYGQHSDFKCNSCGVIFTKGAVNKDEDKYFCMSCIQSGKASIQKPEIKAVQTYPEEKTTSELINDGVINPMRVQKHTDKELNDMMESDAQAMEDMDRERAAMSWENISEAFICHNCEAKTHNGFMKLGTKLCPDCKTGIESNESGDTKEKDRSDVNEFIPPPETQPLRSIEDINSEEYSF